LLVAFGSNASPREFAKAALGKDKSVMSAILSDFPTASEALTVDRYKCAWFILEYLLMVSIKLTRRFEFFRLTLLMRRSRGNSITRLKVS
jgi:hypothetical protein